MPPPASARLKPVGQWSRPPVQVDLGRAAELAAAEDDRAIEQLSAASGRARSAANAGSRTLTCARWTSWLLTWVSQPSERHLDAAHADFDQPAGGQAAAAERRVAVLGADARGLLRDVERLELLGAHHHAGAGERLAVQRGVDAGSPAAGEGPLEDLQVADPRQRRAGRERRPSHVGQARPCGSPTWNASNSPPRKPPRLGH